MRTVRLTVAYDGTAYAGWQAQPGGQSTIQGALQRAWRIVTRETVSIIASGRTDAGVHALAQVAHCRTRTTLPCDRLQRALNALVGPDIVVTRVEDAPAQFHARYSAVAKRYRYRIVTGPVALPFERRYVWHVTAPLDIARMRRELLVLRGRHDVRMFHKTGRPVGDARRRIFDARLRRSGATLDIEIEADGFLHAMVRGIVGTLVDVGRGHRPPGTMQEILLRRDRCLVGPTAPARGLCLMAVRYGRPGRHD